MRRKIHSLGLAPGRRPVAVMAGSESWSEIGGHPAINPKGSWCSYHREPFTYFAPADPGARAASRNPARSRG